MPDNPTVSPTRLASIRWPAGLLERIDAAVPGSDHPNRNAFVVAAVEAALAGEGTAAPTREQVREKLRSALAECVREDGQGFQYIVGAMALATRRQLGDAGPSNLDLVSAWLADAVMALLSRSTAGPQATPDQERPEWPSRADLRVQIAEAGMDASMPLHSKQVNYAANAVMMLLAGRPKYPKSSRVVAAPTGQEEAVTVEYRVVPDA